MDCSQIWICCSKFNFSHFHRWDLWDNIRGERKRNRMKIVQMEASIPSHSLLSEDVSLLRGKGWVIHNWRLVRICVEILRVSIGMGFGVFPSFFLFYPYSYNCELYMFDKPIFVKLICYCVERDPYKSSIFLINMNWWNKVRRNLEWDIDFVFSLFHAF